MKDDFDTFRKAAIAGTVISALISIGIIGFIVWVIIKTMSHFGII